MNRVEMQKRKEVVVNFIKKNNTMPTQTMAKVLKQKYPEFFKDLESARSALRYRLGKGGDDKRKRLGEGLIAHNPKPHPFTIKSLAKDVDFFKLPIKKGKGAIVSDAHIPYHDEVAMYTFLEYIKKKDIDFLFINGDFVDCYPISRFTKKQNKAPYVYEIKALLDFLDMLQAEFPKMQIFYKVGNHEKRHADYFDVNASAIFNVGLNSFKTLLRLPSYEIDPLTHLPDLETDDDDEIFLKLVDRGIRVIPENKITRIGTGPTALHILHGHEKKMSSPVNAARGAYLRTNVNCIVSHFHQVSEHSERRLDGSHVTCWSIGCLQHLQPEYDPYNAKWEHGFGMLEVDGDYWNFSNKKIIKAKVRG